MRLSPAAVRRASAVSLLPSALLVASCTLQVDDEGHVEREEKRFTAPGGSVQLRLYTFDGAVEVRSWDRPDILVQVDKRGENRDALSKIEVRTEEKDGVITVDARNTGRGGFGFGLYVSPSAKIIASVPRETNLVVRTPDGDIAVERLTGRLELHTTDGSIRTVETSGELLAESGDGSIRIEECAGRVEARTEDGTFQLSGTPTSLRVRTSDGSIVLRIRSGAIMDDDWMIATGDGSVTLELPAAFAAQIEADPGSDGRVRSDLKLTNAVGGTRQARVLTGTMGEGGRRLLVKTGDGTIRLVHY